MTTAANPCSGHKHRMTAARTKPLSGLDIQRECVYPPDKVFAQGRVNSTVPFDPAERCQLRCADMDVEMCLATFAPSTMATMAFAVILDAQRFWRESFAQSGFDFFTNSHLLALCSSILWKIHINSRLGVEKTTDADIS